MSKLVKFIYDKCGFFYIPHTKVPVEHKSSLSLTHTRHTHTYRQRDTHTKYYTHKSLHPPTNTTPTHQHHTHPHNHNTHTTPTHTLTHPPTKHTHYTNTHPPPPPQIHQLAHDLQQHPPGTRADRQSRTSDMEAASASVRCRSSPRSPVAFRWTLTTTQSS